MEAHILGAELSHPHWRAGEGVGCVRACAGDMVLSSCGVTVCRHLYIGRRWGIVDAKRSGSFGAACPCASTDCWAAFVWTHSYVSRPREGLSAVHALCAGPQECTSNDIIDDCGGLGNLLYWLSYFVLATYIFANLIISIILDNFAFCFGGLERMIDDNQVRQMKRIWNLYDPKIKRRLPRSMSRPATLGVATRGFRVAPELDEQCLLQRLRGKSLVSILSGWSGGLWA